jgi:hypothetical protein
VNFLRADISDEYQGCLKFIKETDIKRLIVRLLIMGILKERFETQTVRGTSIKNIMVYLTVDPEKLFAILKTLESGRLSVLLSEGMHHDDNNSIKMPFAAKMVTNESNIAHASVAVAVARPYVK